MVSSVGTTSSSVGGASGLPGASLAPSVMASSLVSSVVVASDCSSGSPVGTLWESSELSSASPGAFAPCSAAL